MSSMLDCVIPAFVIYSELDLPCYRYHCSFPWLIKSSLGNDACCRGWGGRGPLSFCPGEEAPSGKVIPPGETKKEETPEWQEWGKKHAREEQRLCLWKEGERRKQEYPVAATPEEGRKIAKKAVGCRLMC